MANDAHRPGRRFPRPWQGIAALVALLAAAGAVLASRGGDEGQRLYANDSPFNTPIGDGSVDPRSDRMIDQLTAEVKANGWPIATAEFTNAIYYADSETPRYDVPLTKYDSRRFAGVPIPDSVRVPEDTDGGVVVIDRSTNCEYDLDEPARVGSNRWTAEFGNALSTDGSGVYPFAMAPSASGFASAAGMILPAELRQGRIDHALAFTMENVKTGGPVAPATGNDGRSDAPGAIPEGARLRLDPELDLDSLGLAPWQKTIARALQEYGMYLVDTGGAVAIRVQHSVSTSYTYPWGDVPYGQMPPELAERLQVLMLPPQREPEYRFVQNDCARLR